MRRAPPWREPARRREGARHGRNLEMMAALLQRLDALDYGTVLPDMQSAETHGSGTGNH